MANEKSPITFLQLDTLADIDTRTTIQAQIDAIGSTLTLDDGKIFIGNASNVPIDSSLSGGLTITNTGLATLGPNCGYATTATAGTTTTLVVTSKMLQYFTGSTTQTVVMPVVSTLALGWKVRIVNNSSGIVTVNSSGSNLISVVSPGTCLEFTCILITGTDAASWDVVFGNADVTAALLTNFSAGAGTVAATDSILAGFNKLAGNTQNLAVINNVLSTYVSGAGAVANTDTVVQAINKLNGNTAAQGVWTTFAPTVTVGGDTAPVYSTNTGRYALVGKTAFVDIYLTGDGGAEGSGSTQVSIALPVAAGASNPTSNFPAGYALNDTVEYLMYGQIAGGGSVVTLKYLAIVVTATTFAAFTAGDQNNATRTVRLKFAYETA